MPPAIQWEITARVSSAIHPENLARFTLGMLILSASAIPAEIHTESVSGVPPILFLYNVSNLSRVSSQNIFRNSFYMQEISFRNIAYEFLQAYH